MKGKTGGKATGGASRPGKAAGARTRSEARTPAKPSVRTDRSAREAQRQLKQQAIRSAERRTREVQHQLKQRAIRSAERQAQIQAMHNKVSPKNKQVDGRHKHQTREALLRVAGRNTAVRKAVSTAANSSANVRRYLKKSAERTAELGAKKQLRAKGYTWVRSLSYGKNKTGVDIFGVKRGPGSRAEIAHIEAKGSYSPKQQVSDAKAKARLVTDRSGIKQGTTRFFWNRVERNKDRGSQKQQRIARNLMDLKNSGKVSCVRNFVYLHNTSTLQGKLVPLRTTRYRE
jgi:hypothetical protein